MIRRLNGIKIRYWNHRRNRRKKKKKTVERTVRGSKIKTTEIGDTEVGGVTSAVAGVGSGIS